MEISGMNEVEHGARFAQYWINVYLKRNKPLQRIAASIRRIEHFFQVEGLLCAGENIHRFDSQEVNWKPRKFDVDDNRLKNLSEYERELFETAKYQSEYLSEYGVCESTYDNQDNYSESLGIVSRVLSDDIPKLPECDSFLWSSRCAKLIDCAVEDDNVIRLQIGKHSIDGFHYLIALNMDATEQEIVHWVKSLVKIHRIHEDISNKEALCESEQDFIKLSSLRSSLWNEYDKASYAQEYVEFINVRNSKSIKTLWKDRSISLHMYDHKEKFGGTTLQTAKEVYEKFELYKHDYDFPEYDTKEGQSGKRRFERLLRCAEDSIRRCEIVPFSG